MAFETKLSNVIRRKRQDCAWWLQYARKSIGEAKKLQEFTAHTSRKITLTRHYWFPVICARYDPLHTQNVIVDFSATVIKPSNAKVISSLGNIGTIDDAMFGITVAKWLSSRRVQPHAWFCIAQYSFLLH